ncbi:MAG TPA: hypothetical protein VHX88_05625 [Solirubrobacteraceae bacterium]|nr:hypothetical protein [Solirubrobacteraceae bacterium]
MNSVTRIAKFSTSRSPGENAHHSRPNRSRMSRAWPAPVTAPSRPAISCPTYSTGASRSSTHSSRTP